MSSDRFQAGLDEEPGHERTFAPAVSSRVEKTVLRAQVEALSSELERKERRHGEVLEQYERLLESRNADTDDKPVDRGEESVRAGVRSRLSSIFTT